MKRPPLKSRRRLAVVARAISTQINASHNGLVAFRCELEGVCSEAAVVGLVDISQPGVPLRVTMIYDKPKRSRRRQRPGKRHGK